MLPFGWSWDSPDLQMASLDHAMWFHRPFRADEWLLYDQTAFSTGVGARARRRERSSPDDGRWPSPSSKRDWSGEDSR